MEEVPESEKFFPAQLVFLALGFLGPQAEVIKALGVKQDARSNIQTPAKVRLVSEKHDRDLTHRTCFQKYSTNVEGVFAAGDCRRGQSLIVWGIKYVPSSILLLDLRSNWFSSEGRGVAAEVDAWLMANTRLPSAGGIKTRVSHIRIELGR